MRVQVWGQASVEVWESALVWGQEWELVQAWVWESGWVWG